MGPRTGCAAREWLFAAECETASCTVRIIEKPQKFEVTRRSGVYCSSRALAGSRRLHDALGRSQNLPKGRLSKRPRTTCPLGVAAVSPCQAGSLAPLRPPAALPAQQLSREEAA